MQSPWVVLSRAPQTTVLPGRMASAVSAGRFPVERPHAAGNPSPDQWARPAIRRDSAFGIHPPARRLADVWLRLGPGCRTQSAEKRSRRLVPLDHVRKARLTIESASRASTATRPSSYSPMHRSLYSGGVLGHTWVAALRDRGDRGGRRGRRGIVPARNIHSRVSIRHITHARESRPCESGRRPDDARSTGRPSTVQLARSRNSRVTAFTTHGRIDADR